MLGNSCKRREVQCCCFTDPKITQCHTNFSYFYSPELVDVNEIYGLVFRPSILYRNKSGWLVCSNPNDCFSVPINHVQLPACGQILSHEERKCVPYLELNQYTKHGVCAKSHWFFVEIGALRMYKITNDTGNNLVLNNSCRPNRKIWHSF